MVVMEQYVRTALEGGALGLSLGLGYVHGKHISREELRMLGEVVADCGGYVAAHVRDEGKGLVDAVDEVLTLAETSQVKAHITHLKAVGESNWPLMKKAMERIDLSRMHGSHITFDVYPYTMTGSVLYTFLPEWVTDGGKKMMIGRLKNDNIVAQVVKEVEDLREVLEYAVVAQTSHGRTIEGRSLGQIARDRGVTLGEVVIDVLISTEGRAIVLCEALLEENVVRAITDPYAIISSNSPGYTITPSMRHNHGNIHPRSFGAFARLLERYVEKKQDLTWETAIYKSSAKAADVCGISDRGRLQEGFAADVLIINPREMKDRTTQKEPIAYASGIEYVFINGVPVISAGNPTGIRPGQSIRKK